MREVVFGCGICGKGIKDEEPVSITAGYESRDAAWQTMWAHTGCLKGAFQHVGEGPIWEEDDE